MFKKNVYIYSTATNAIAAVDAEAAGSGMTLFSILNRKTGDWLDTVLATGADKALRAWCEKGDSGPGPDQTEQQFMAELKEAYEAREVTSL